MERNRMNPNLAATLRRHGIERNMVVTQPLARRIARELGITLAAFEAQLKEYNATPTKPKEPTVTHAPRKTSRKSVHDALVARGWTLTDPLTKALKEAVAQELGATAKSVACHVDSLRAAAEVAAANPAPVIVPDAVVEPAPYVPYPPLTERAAAEMTPTPVPVTDHGGACEIHTTHTANRCEECVSIASKTAQLEVVCLRCKSKVADYCAPCIQKERSEFDVKMERALKSMAERGEALTRVSRELTDARAIIAERAAERDEARADLTKNEAYNDERFAKLQAECNGYRTSYEDALSQCRAVNAALDAASVPVGVLPERRVELLAVRVEVLEQQHAEKCAALANVRNDLDLSAENVRLQRELDEALTANENLQRTMENLSGMVSAREPLCQLFYADTWEQAAEIAKRAIEAREQRDWLLAQLRERVAAKRETDKRTIHPWFRLEAPVEISMGYIDDPKPTPELTEEHRRWAVHTFYGCEMSDTFHEESFSVRAAVLQLAADLAALAASR